MRRWVPTDLEVTTPVAITWRARKTNTRNDGVTGSLHINGLMVDSRVVPGNDTAGEFRTYYANLSPGDIVDLALSPEGVANRSDGNDSASTRCCLMVKSTSITLTKTSFTQWWTRLAPKLRT